MKTEIATAPLFCLLKQAYFAYSTLTILRVIKWFSSVDKFHRFLNPQIHGHQMWDRADIHPINHYRFFDIPVLFQIFERSICNSCSFIAPFSLFHSGFCDYKPRPSTIDGRTWIRSSEEERCECPRIMALFGSFLAILLFSTIVILVKSDAEYEIRPRRLSDEALENAVETCCHNRHEKCCRRVLKEQTCLRCQTSDYDRKSWMSFKIKPYMSREEIISTLTCLARLLHGDDDIHHISPDDIHCCHVFNYTIEGDYTNSMNSRNCWHRCVNRRRQGFAVGFDPEDNYKHYRCYCSIKDQARNGDLSQYLPAAYGMGKGKCVYDLSKSY
ncbi:hypothetical protein WR25_22283 [Diploscapter pachys]|uniref:Uncharacterized protein n=1 Tax=Diploscapter pachys TaxID=2018661 RepID=A0A2A2L5P4_9BILA|nr:hypothetical protein WR25_22283 [Diploscapter pachys]